MVTSPVCSELRDRAARAAWEVWTEEPCEMAMSTWCRVVDAVAAVLAEHLAKGCGCWDRHAAEANDLRAENSALRARAERAEADLARARNLASEVLHLMRFRLDGRPVSIGEAHTLIAWSRGVLASGPAGAAHTEEET